MTWDVAYRFSGETKIRFTTIEGKDEFEARYQFHLKYQKCFIKTIIKKDSPAILQARLDMQKQDSEKNVRNGIS